MPDDAPATQNDKDKWSLSSQGQESQGERTEEPSGDSREPNEPKDRNRFKEIVAVAAGGVVTVVVIIVGVISPLIKKMLGLEDE